MKNCNKCGTQNSEDAKFCRHCGTRMPENENIMDKYPEMNFVPTNLTNWKKPWVAMVIKTILLIPVVLSSFVCLSGLSGCFFYNQDSGLDEDNFHYETIITDAVFDGMFVGLKYCYMVNGSYYESYYGDRDNPSSCYPSGDYIPDPKTYTKERALSEYRERIFEICIPNMIIVVVFLCLTFSICGYSKRPKNTRSLCEVADYCQKYSYWGIFRRRKTPKLVFFAKDNKLGILDVAHYCIFLPARYDYLSWREKNKYLNAIADGRNCIIDIYGKELR